MDWSSFLMLVLTESTSILDLATVLEVTLLIVLVDVDLGRALAAGLSSSNLGLKSGCSRSCAVDFLRSASFTIRFMFDFLFVSNEHF